MHEQLQMTVRPVGDTPTDEVLAVAAVLALEWAAPYVDVTIGGKGTYIVEPDINAVAGLLRLKPERAERMRLAGRAALQVGDSEIHLVENNEGDWNLTEELDSWWATGVALEAASFTASTPVGHAIAEILNFSRTDDQRAVELLENSQGWALEQTDRLISQIATENPRRIADLLVSLSADLDIVNDTHALLRARYQADIELMGRNR